MHIHLYAPVVAHDVRTFLDVTNATLTQDVQLLKTQIFGHVHVPLGGGETLGGHVQGRIAGEGLLGDQYSRLHGCSSGWESP